MKKIILNSIGTISLGLACLGILLPILPTTPFLLVSAYCYFNSSKRMYNWMINHRVFGTYLQNYMEHKVISKKHKSIVLFFLWCSLGLSIILTTSVHLQLFLGIVGVLVSIHILLLRSSRKVEVQSRQI